MAGHSQRPKNRKNDPQRKPKRGAKKSKQSRRKNPMGTGSIPPIAMCAAKYALAIADPLNPQAVGACVPRHPSRPSQKVMSWLDGVVTVGSNGYGYIMVAPTTQNNLQCVYYTHSISFAGTGTQISVDTPTPHVLAVPMANIPYSHDALIDTSGFNDPRVAGRVVSCAISLEYIGTENNRGGNVMCFVDPDHEPVSNLDFTTIISRRETEISSPDANRTKCWISAFGLKDEELSYPSPIIDGSDAHGLEKAIVGTVYPYSGGASLKLHTGTWGGDDQRGAPIMCAVIAGAVAGTTYRFKVVQHLEYVGQLADHVISTNHTDAKSFELVQSAAAMMYGKKVASPMKTMGKVMKECLIEAFKEASSSVALAAGSALLAAVL